MAPKGYDGRTLKFKLGQVLYDNKAQCYVKVVDYDYENTLVVYDYIITPLTEVPKELLKNKNWAPEIGQRYNIAVDTAEHNLFLPQDKTIKVLFGD